MGLLRDGYLQVPPLTPHSNVVGWYKYGPVPGENGPSVLIGHRDSHGVAVFYLLADLVRGDRVYVTRSDRSTAIFTVTTVRNFRKRAFPANLVYESGNYPVLRLITCGGTFNYLLGSYEQNIVVFAAFSTVSRPPGRSRHARPHVHAHPAARTPCHRPANRILVRRHACRLANRGTYFARPRVAIRR
jgi:Sortase domain